MKKLNNEKIKEFLDVIKNTNYPQSDIITKKQKIVKHIESLDLSIDSNVIESCWVIEEYLSELNSRSMITPNLRAVLNEIILNIG